MTLEEIFAKVEYIREISDDNECAHAEEDELRENFIKYVATLDIPSLAEKAKAVLKTNELNFERWYA